MKDILNIPQELLGTIEKYLNDKMPDDEKMQFKKRIAEESLLKEQVEEVKFFRLGIRKAVLTSKLDDFHEDVSNVVLTSKEKKIFKLNYKHIAVAASVFILLSSVWFFNQINSNEALFNKYYVEDRGLATNMGESNSYAFDDAMVDYKQGKYNTAIDKWHILLKSKPENDTLNYFLGVAQLANKNENEAVNHLKTTVKTVESAFINEAYFYLGLSYLKMDDTDLAIKYLERSNSETSKTIISALKK